MALFPSRRTLVSIFATVNLFVFILYSIILRKNQNEIVPQNLRSFSTLVVNAVTEDQVEVNTLEDDYQVSYLIEPTQKIEENKSEPQATEHPQPKIEFLEDIDIAENQPNNNRSSRQIFFLDTSTPDGGILKLGARESCSIESAAKYHPNHIIYVLVTGETKIDHNNASSKYYKILKENFKNVLFRSFDPINFTIATPVEDFFRSGKHRNSMFYETHLADILRLVVLWKYGGLYFDLDVVVLKNFDKLGEDYLGKANEFVLMSGTMQFSGTGIGHTVADLSLRRLTKDFNGKGWGSNGPKLITKVMTSICGGAEMAKNMYEQNCHGMHFLLNKKFIPVRHYDHQLYFNEKSSGQVLARIRRYGAFTAHLFHHMTQNIELKKSSTCAYNKLAIYHCPKVFMSVDEYFD